MSVPAAVFSARLRVAVSDRERRRGVGLFVVVDGHHQRPVGQAGVLARPGDGVGQRRAVIGRIRVIGRAHGHRLRPVPIARGEGQRVLHPARHGAGVVHRHLGVVAGNGSPSRPRSAARRGAPCRTPTRPRPASARSPTAPAPPSRWPPRCRWTRPRCPRGREWASSSATGCSYTVTVSAAPAASFMVRTTVRPRTATRATVRLKPPTPPDERDPRRHRGLVQRLVEGERQLRPGNRRRD